jgi:hypothetical protein
MPKSLRPLKLRLTPLKKKERLKGLKAEQDKENAVISGFKENIKTLVSKDDKFELIKNQGEDGIELVFETVDALHQQTGKIDLEKALELVEGHLEQQMESIIKSTQKLKKFFPEAVEPKPKNETVAKTEQTSPSLVSTLTHQAVSSPVAPTQKGC